MIRSETLMAGRVHGYLAQAERPRGGVLILPTITGVDRWMQDRANLLAEAGYSALVWDPYPGETPPADTASAMPRAAKLNDGRLDDMAACADHLRTAVGGASVGVMGFCLGGRYSLLLAAQDRRLAACVAFYPSVRIPNKPNESRDAVGLAAGIACPVHLVHGTGDEVFVHAVFLKVREALEQRPAPTFVQVHPGAVHSFMRPDYQSIQANGQATRLAWPPVMAFLQTCLSAPSP
jgi:carboxymethylenebutenolidase